MQVRNVVWNACGLGVPLACAMYAVPVLIERLGQEKFAVIAIAWGLLGYAVALDFGVSRALMIEIARARAVAITTEVVALVRGAATLSFVLSAGTAALIGGVVVQLDLLRLYELKETAQREFEGAALLVLMCVPVQAVAAAFRATSEALLRAATVSLIRGITGALSFLVPALLSMHTSSITTLLFASLLPRVVTLPLYWATSTYALRTEAEGACNATSVRCAGSLSNRRRASRTAFDLLGTSAWFTTGSLSAALLMGSDRLIIGAVSGLTAVTAYTVAYDITVNLLFLAGAVSTAITPALTTAYVHSKVEFRSGLHVWIVRVAVGGGMVVAVLAPSAGVLLELWLGAELQEVSVTIARVLLFGVLLASIGAVLGSALIAVGRVSSFAISQALQVVPFLFLANLLAADFGPLGVAYLWTARAALDLVINGLLVRRYVHRARC
jgi:O-antigen/teichoic acid export membrane protein